MFRKKRLLILFSILMAFLITQVALGYALNDPGYITGTKIVFDGFEYLRPGLEDGATLPMASTYGPYPVQAQLADGPITSVELHYGPPGGGPWDNVLVSIDTGVVSGEIPEFNPADYGFNYCQPYWEFAFFLRGVDEFGNQIEVDERHYLDDMSTGGDPYLFQIENLNPNQHPFADPAGPYEVDRWDPITLNGNGSSDPEGFGLTYKWDIYVTWPDYESSPYYELDPNFGDGAGPMPEFTFEENGEYHVRLRVTDECGEQIVEETTIMVYDPHMVVIPQHNSIVGNNWRPGLMLTLEIDGVIYGPVPVEPIGEKDEYGYHFNMDDYGVLVVPGMEVVLYGDYDGIINGDEIVQPHTVRDFTINEVDLAADLVSGTADAGSSVRVRIDDPWWVEIVAGADSSGAWVADFGSAGLADIQPETIINVLQQNEFDSSHTLRIWGEEQHLPHIEASLTYNWIGLFDFTPDTPVSLQVWDIEGNPQLPEGFQVITDEYGWAWFDQHEIDVVPDMFIEAADDATGIVKQLILKDLTLDTFDIEADYITGTGPVEALIWVNAGNESSGYGEEVQIDEFGDWELDLAGIFDIQEDMGTQALLPDEDGDSTVAEYEEPRLPLFTIQPEHKWAHGEFWPIGVPITLTIYQDGPGSGILYQEAKISEPAEHNPEIGAVDFDLQAVEALERGLYVTMEGGEIFKDTWIADLHYNYLDVGLDLAKGQGPGGNYGFLVASNTDGFFMELPEMGPGDWIADFGGAGYDATNVPDTFILRWDEDGDETMIHLPEPFFIEGSVPVDPIEIGTPIQVSATFESSLFDGPDDALLDISFCFDVDDSCMDPSNWLPSSNLNDAADYSYTTGELDYVINASGVYPIIAHAFNPDGPDSFALLGMIVVYDPDAGFVTGGGWITTAEGSYLPDPSLSGKATYGFVSKYQKKADVPTGQTEFHLNVGEMKFKSTNYDWLIITWDDIAIYSGTGTINGEGEYFFTIWAGDGERDTFRIRIWEQNEFGEDIIIFDNGFDQPTEGGNIVIHRK
ncbi:MAG: PKD domain-containing protein [Anaerolineales bacterium]|nr:PKD domain-containing protein [Anaerolineales bacterium]